MKVTISLYDIFLFCNQVGFLYCDLYMRGYHWSEILSEVTGGEGL